MKFHWTLRVAAFCTLFFFSHSSVITQADSTLAWESFQKSAENLSVRFLANHFSPSELESGLSKGRLPEKTDSSKVETLAKSRSELRDSGRLILGVPNYFRVNDQLPRILALSENDIWAEIERTIQNYEWIRGLTGTTISTSGTRLSGYELYVNLRIEPEPGKKPYEITKRIVSLTLSKSGTTYASAEADGVITYSRKSELRSASSIWKRLTPWVSVGIILASVTWVIFFNQKPPLPVATLSDFPSESQKNARQSDWFNFNFNADFSASVYNVRLLIDWIKKQGYPHPKILDEYAAALDQAQPMPEEIFQSTIFGKKTNVKDPGHPTIALNIRFLHVLLKYATSIQSKDFLMEALGFAIIREAHGFHMLRVSKKEYEEFYALANDVLIKRMDQSLGNQFAWPSGAYSVYLSENEHQLERLMVIQAAGEFYEAKKMVEAAQWAKEKGIYASEKVSELIQRSPETLRPLLAARSKILELMSAKNDAKLLAIELRILTRMLIPLFIRNDLNAPAYSMRTYGHFVFLQMERFVKSQGKSGINPDRVLQDVAETADFLPVAETIIERVRSLSREWETRRSELRSPGKFKIFLMSTIAGIVATACSSINKPPPEKTTSSSHENFLISGKNKTDLLQAIRGLGALEGRPVFDSLILYSDHEDLEIREAVFDALVPSDDPYVLKTLFQLVNGLGDREAHWKRIVDAMKKMKTEDLVIELRNQLATTPTKEAVMALGESGAKEAVPVLFEILNDRQHKRFGVEYSSFAEDALLKLGQKSLVTGYLTEFLKNNSADDTHRLVARMLDEIGEDALQVLVPRVLYHGDEWAAKAINMMNEKTDATSFAIQYLDTAIENDPGNSMGYLRTARNLLDRSRALGIKYPFRLGLKSFEGGLLTKLVENRSEVPNALDQRPVAVVVFTRSDWNGAFSNVKIMEDLINRGYRVLYFESSDRQETIDSVLLATQDQKAAVIILGAHSSKSAMNFGSKNPSMIMSRPFGMGVWAGSSDIHLLNEEYLKNSGISDRLLDGGHIILSACSSGEGREKEANLANMFRRIFPQAMHIWSTVLPAPVPEIEFDDQNRIQNVKFTNDGKDSTYIGWADKLNSFDPIAMSGFVGAMVTRSELRTKTSRIRKKSEEKKKYASVKKAKLTRRNFLTATLGIVSLGTVGFAFASIWLRNRKQTFEEKERDKWKTLYLSYGSHANLADAQQTLRALNEAYQNAPVDYESGQKKLSIIFEYILNFTDIRPALEKQRPEYQALSDQEFLIQAKEDLRAAYKRLLEKQRRERKLGLSRLGQILQGIRNRAPGLYQFMQAIYEFAAKHQSLVIFEEPSFDVWYENQFAFLLSEQVDLQLFQNPKQALQLYKSMIAAFSRNNRGRDQDFVRLVHAIFEEEPKQTVFAHRGFNHYANQDIISSGRYKVKLPHLNFSSTDEYSRDGAFYFRNVQSADEISDTDAFEALMEGALIDSMNQSFSYSNSVKLVKVIIDRMSGQDKGVSRTDREAKLQSVMESLFNLIGMRKIRNRRELVIEFYNRGIILKDELQYFGFRSELRNSNLERERENQDLARLKYLFVELLRSGIEAANVKKTDGKVLNEIGVGLSKRLKDLSKKRLNKWIAALDTALAASTAVPPDAKQQSRLELLKQTKEKTIRAQELMEVGNGPAANTLLLNWAQKIGELYLKTLDEKFGRVQQKRRVFGGQIRRDRRTHEYVLSPGRFTKFQVGKDESISLVAFKETRYKTIWEAFRAIDHQLDSEYTNIVHAKNVLQEIENIRNGLEPYRSNSDESLPDSVKQETVQALDLLAAKLNSQWIVEKELAQLAVLSAKSQLEAGNWRFASQILYLASQLVAQRLKDVEQIIERIEEGRLASLRRAIAVRNNYLLTRISKMKSWLWKYALGLSSYLQNNLEPDLRGVRELVIIAHSSYNRAEAARARKQWSRMRHFNKEADAYLKLAEERVQASVKVQEFVQNYRGRFKRIRLSGVEERTARERAFREQYAEFVSQNPSFPKPHLWGYRFYQAIFVPLNIDNPVKKDERIPNPEFIAFSVLIRMAETEAIPRILKQKNVFSTPKSQAGQLNTLKEFLESVKSSGTIDQLDSANKETLIRKIAEDRGANPDQFFASIKKAAELVTVKRSELRSESDLSVDDIESIKRLREFAAQMIELEKKRDSGNASLDFDFLGMKFLQMIRSEMPAQEQTILFKALNRAYGKKKGFELGGLFEFLVNLAFTEGKRKVDIDPVDALLFSAAGQLRSFISRRDLLKLSTALVLDRLTGGSLGKTVASITVPASRILQVEKFSLYALRTFVWNEADWIVDRIGNELSDSIGPINQGHYFLLNTIFRAQFHPKVWGEDQLRMFGEQNESALAMMWQAAELEADRLWPEEKRRHKGYWAPIQANLDRALRESTATGRKYGTLLDEGYRAIDHVTRERDFGTQVPWRHLRSFQTEPACDQKTLVERIFEKKLMDESKQPGSFLSPLMSNIRSIEPIVKQSARILKALPPEKVEEAYRLVYSGGDDEALLDWAKRLHEGKEELGNEDENISEMKPAKEELGRLFEIRRKVESIERKLNAFEQPYLAQAEREFYNEWGPIEKIDSKIKEMNEKIQALRVAWIEVDMRGEATTRRSELRTYPLNGSANGNGLMISGIITTYDGGFSYMKSIIPNLVRFANRMSEFGIRLKIKRQDQNGPVLEIHTLTFDLFSSLIYPLDISNYGFAVDVIIEDPDEFLTGQSEEVAEDLDALLQGYSDIATHTDLSEVRLKAAALSGVRSELRRIRVTDFKAVVQQVFSPAASSGTSEFTGIIFSRYLFSDYGNPELIAPIMKEIAESLDQPLAVIVTDGIMESVIKEVNSKLSREKQIVMQKTYQSARETLMRERGASAVKIIAADSERGGELERAFRLVTQDIQFIKSGQISSLFGILGLSQEIVNNYRAQLNLAYSA